LTQHKNFYKVMLSARFPQEPQTITQIKLHRLT
jgi:hypothetical protein